MLFAPRRSKDILSIQLDIQVVVESFDHSSMRLRQDGTLPHQSLRVGTIRIERGCGVATSRSACAL